LADNGETDKASEIIHKFVGDIKKADVPTIYTPNIVLNYLINRKIRQCKDENIDFNCFISGDIQGIEDVDMYILLENLIDNAIEACVQTDNPRIHLSIFFDAGSMLIEVGNSIKEDILKLNVDMNSTKSDKLNHGFGLKNVKDVVSKYHGSISYDIKIEGYLVCNVTIYAQN
jgi:sensor histidine kinase regulating citrate/malate metabolism